MTSGLLIPPLLSGREAAAYAQCIPEEGRAVHSGDVEPEGAEAAPCLAGLIAPMRGQRRIPRPGAAPGPIHVVQALPVAQEDDMLSPQRGSSSKGC